MEKTFDLIIIGAGPGGYVAAIKAAKLGLRTAIVEYREVGGTCLNRGCIPTKAMLHAANLYKEIKEAKKFGITAENVSFDYSKIIEYKEETCLKLREGILSLLKANGVVLIKGKAVLEKDKIVTVFRNGAVETYRAQSIILATGAVPSKISVKGSQLDGVLNSEELFLLEEAPQSLVIVGGGVIGVEMAKVFSSLNAKITLIEAAPKLISNFDKEIAQSLKMTLKKQGVEVYTSSLLKSIEKNKDGLLCSFEENGKNREVLSPYVLFAVGREPNIDGLFGEGVTIEMSGKKVAVDGGFETSIKGVYAIGDLCSDIQLAHNAVAQGIHIAQKLGGGCSTEDLGVIPSCIYTNPEIASVGITEQSAKKAEIPIKVGKFIMSGNGKALISKDERGFIKVITHRESGIILGAQLMCARATDMIGEFTM
ncbi:dihydrolipoyl dehydrogenase, partial [Anaerotignum sp.]|uniref:dihydrolipoyl dehydrogenase n=1 Tax=Anaerotignum sp. TaxID=2039241 RepID=UPI0027150099